MTIYGMNHFDGCLFVLYYVVISIGIAYHVYPSFMHTYVVYSCSSCPHHIFLSLSVTFIFYSWFDILFFAMKKSMDYLHIWL